MENIEKWRNSARKNLIIGTNSRKGICETLRLIYDYIHDLKEKEEITELLVDAMLMAKKMQDRLKYYKRTYNDDTGNNAKNLIRLLESVKRRRMRKARIYENSFN